MKKYIISLLLVLTIIVSPAIANISSIDTPADTEIVSLDSHSVHYLGFMQYNCKGAPIYVGSIEEAWNMGCMSVMIVTKQCINRPE